MVFTGLDTGVQEVCGGVWDSSPRNLQFLVFVYVLCVSLF